MRRNVMRKEETPKEIKVERVISTLKAVATHSIRIINSRFRMWCKIHRIIFGSKLKIFLSHATHKLSLDSFVLFYWHFRRLCAKRHLRPFVVCSFVIDFLRRPKICFRSQKKIPIHCTSTRSRHIDKISLKCDCVRSRINLITQRFFYSQFEMTSLCVSVCFVCYAGVGHNKSTLCVDRMHSKWIAIRA